MTGAAGGIGRAIARELLAQGATVHGIDRDAAGLGSLAQEGAGRFRFAYRSDITPYTRFGDWFVLLCALIAAAGFLLRRRVS